MSPTDARATVARLNAEIENLERIKESKLEDVAGCRRLRGRIDKLTAKRLSFEKEYWHALL